MNKKKISNLSQKEKFLRAIKEEQCESIEGFEKKLKKMARVKKLGQKKKPKK
jgi:hypothetical protein